jgi:hypothetical protein
MASPEYKPIPNSFAIKYSILPAPPLTRYALPICFISSLALFKHFDE